MTESVDPPEIARREFEVVRRGYDQHAVRGFLHQVSSVLQRALAAEGDLRTQIGELERRLAATEHPDEATMMGLLGEETTRVLTSAREAAADIRSKAEQSAAGIIADATAQAAQTRNAAVAEADQRLADARAEADKVLTSARGELERRTKEATEAADRIKAEAALAAQTVRDDAQRALAGAQEEADGIVEQAKVQGKEMLAEAQAVRERVLKDLATKRKRARQQLEQLNAGRERLLQAYDVVRTTVEDATNELTASVTDARLAAAAASRRVAAEPDASVEELDEELIGSRFGELPITVTHAGPMVQAPPGRREREAAEAAEATEVVVADPPPATERHPASPSDFDPMPLPTTSRLAAAAATEPEPEPVVPEPEPERVVPEPEPEPVVPVPEPERAVPEPEPEPVVPVPEPERVVPEPEPEPEPAVQSEPVADAPETDAPAPEPTAVPEPAADAKPKAAAVFARLHAEVPPTSEAEPEVEADVEPEPEAAPAEPASPSDAAFAARAEALAAIERDLGKRLKRTLADEQNEVLDQLRRGKPSGVGDLLPVVDEHAGRWATAAVDPLGAAAAAGAAAIGGRAGAVADLADELARGLVLPLRDRIERSFVASDGNLDDVADRVRALYREWKNQRLTETVPHFAAAAYAGGLYDAVPADAKVHWVADPAKGACPDCDDNVLAGSVARGDEFPTGDRCAPAHAGCRCLVLVVSA